MPRTLVGTGAAALAFLLLLPRGGAAQEPAASPARSAVPSAAGGFPVDAARLMPATYRYDVIVTGDNGAMPVGTHVVSFADGTFSGQPAWTVIDHRESHEPFVVLAAADTVLLARESLRPLRWGGVAGDARFVAAFARDSVYGGASAPNARSTFTVGGAPQMVTTEGALDAMLLAAPLARGWTADASMLVADLGGARVVPLRVVVEREAQLELPVGLFDVWVVRVSTDGAERWLWIDKRTQVVVRTAMAAPHMPRMVVERILAQPLGW